MVVLISLRSVSFDPSPSTPSKDHFYRGRDDDMAEGNSNAGDRRSRLSGNWRLSSLWGAPGTPLGPTQPCHHCYRDSMDEGFESMWAHDGVPSLQPRTFSRLGATDANGMQIGTFAFSPPRDSTAMSAQMQDFRPETGYSAAAANPEVFRLGYESAEDDASMHLDRDTRDRSFELSRGNEEADLGLVRPQRSFRHQRSLRHAPSQHSVSHVARKLSEKMSSDGLSRHFGSTYSKRTVKRQSARLSALPTLPDALRSGDGTSLRPSSLESEKSLVKASRPASGMPPVPPGFGPPPGPQDPTLVVWDGPNDPVSLAY